jgi:hypothetical protein
VRSSAAVRAAQGFPALPEYSGPLPVIAAPGAGLTCNMGFNHVTS